MATLATKEGIGHFLANVPKTIEQALERPPISDLLRNGAKQNMIEAALAAEIIKVSNMLTVGGNLREGQALQIAIQLIADYPNEALEDFCLCLRRGLKNQYGNIFRFDVVIINEWMQKYLEEKYLALERKLMEEKDEPFKPVKLEAQDPEKHQSWLNKLKEATRPIEGKKIPPITDKDIKTEGQEKPKAKLYPVTTLSQAQKHELHVEWVRKNFDKYTADKLPTWKPEQEWIDALSEDDRKAIIKRVK